MSISLPTTYAPAADFPGYRIGSDGSVWSQRRPGIGPEIYGEWRPIKLVANSRGYMVVTLCKNKMRYTKMVHRLVAEAFLGPCPSGMECCHNNGVAADNRLLNLRYDTHKSNIDDRARHGRVPKGENHARAKLTELQVHEIRSAYKAGGVTLKQIAKKYGVNFTLIHAIIKRKIWQHVAA